MQKTHLAIGVIIGFIFSFLGTLLLLYSFTPFEGFGDFKYIKQLGYLGKFVTLGSIINLLLFYLFLHKQKEYIARGILLATIIIAVSTLFMQ